MRKCLVVLLVSLGSAAPFAAQATPFSAFLMDERKELALARSAAPEVITARAGFFVLRASGRYEPVNPSGNGFHCLVERSFTVPTTDAAQFYEPRVVAPICFNVEASATVMQRDLFIAPLVAGATSLPEIRRLEAEAYETGRLKYPSKPAIAYMFSSAHWLGPNVGHWHPHVMIWAPGLTPADLVPADVGTFGVNSGFPIMDARFGPQQPLIAIPAARAIEPKYPGGK
jgi:hypothetical protein